MHKVKLHVYYDFNNFNLIGHGTSNALLNACDNTEWDMGDINFISVIHVNFYRKINFDTRDFLIFIHVKCDHNYISYTVFARSDAVATT